MRPLCDKLGASFFMLFKFYGVMDIFHAGIGPKAIYCLYLQGINAMNQKTALFVVTNIQRRMDAN